MQYWTIFLLLAVTSVRAQVMQNLDKPKESILVVGTYTNNGSNTDEPPKDSTGSKGIYVYRWDPVKGRARLLSVMPAVNPSYLTFGPDGSRLYACMESKTQADGVIGAFAFDRNKGRLQLLNKRSSGGANPVYVSVDLSGRWVAAANYTGGCFSVFPIDQGPGESGALGPASAIVYHHGHSIDTTRQTKSHVHSVLFSPDGRSLFVQDLGLDKVLVYPLADGAPGQPDTIKATPGSGPRHLVFHGAFVYLLEEMGGQIDVYRWNTRAQATSSATTPAASSKATATLPQFVERVPTHPGDKKGPYRSSDLHFSPDGRFLYATNRESENNIAIFSVDSVTGRLSAIGYQPCMGIEPRNFTIDPSGDWLLVGNQLSGEIVVFHIDKWTGLLTLHPQRIRVPSPSCLKMIP